MMFKNKKYQLNGAGVRISDTAREGSSYWWGLFSGSRKLISPGIQAACFRRAACVAPSAERIRLRCGLRPCLVMQSDLLDEAGHPSMTGLALYALPVCLTGHWFSSHRQKSSCGIA